MSSVRQPLERRQKRVHSQAQVEGYLLEFLFVPIITSILSFQAATSFCYGCCTPHDGATNEPAFGSKQFF
jgi:hypothetical protein